MLTLPVEFTSLMIAFAPLFSWRVWQHAQTLVVGAILAPRKRTVTAALRVMGLSQARHFQSYHRVLNRAVWSSRQASRLLLILLVQTFTPSGPLVLGLDDTLERRRGAKINAKGIYRDPVRSSHRHFVKASGLRWLCLMLLVPIPWAGRVWALPFLTVLAPSQRYHQERGQRHKKLTDWARQMILQVRRWCRHRPLVVVADSSFAALELLGAVAQMPQPLCLIIRLRLDAALYQPAPPCLPGAKGRPRRKGARLPTLEQLLACPATVWTEVRVPHWYGEGARMVETASHTAVWYHAGLPLVPLRWVLVRDPLGKFTPQALLCTDLEVPPAQILAWFVLRWQLEVTFAEMRAHLGVETQRQWSDRAIDRTTPALMGLFSVVTLLAHWLGVEAGLPVRQASWYQKAQPTFTDALAAVRQCLWCQTHFSMSHSETEMVKIPKTLFVRFTHTLCYAA
jgi:DDE superfamily endonuclease